MPKPPAHRHSGESRNPVSQSSFPRRRESSDFDSDTSSLPDGWRVCYLGDPAIAQLIMGQSPPSSTYNKEKTGLPFFQGKADFGYISPKPRVWCSAPSRTGRQGDILMSVRAPVGDVNLATEECALGRGVAAIRPSEGTNGIFLFYSLQCNKRQLVAASSGAIFESINKTALHELELQLPPKSEQEKIAAVLWKVQRAIATQDHLIASTRDLKASVMQRLFTRGLRDEPLKDTEIGPIPQSWKVDSLANCCRKPEYGVTASAKDQPIGPRFLRITDITESGVNWNNVPYCACSDEDHKKKRLEHDDIVFARIGATTGKSFIVKSPPNSVFASYLIRVRPKEDLSPDYLYYYFNTESYWQHINANKDNNMKGGVNGSVLSQLLIPIPPNNEQRAIAAALAAIDRKLAHHQKKRTALNDLFQTLLHKLMTAEIRVIDLDINTSEVATPALQGETA